MTRNYWVVSPNVKNDKNEENGWKDFICDYGYACIGYGDDHPLGVRFCNEIQLGDCILVAQGANWQKELFIAGIVKSEAYWDEWDPMPSEACIRQLDPWINNTELSKLGIKFNENATKGSTKNPGTIYLLKPDSNITDRRIVEKLEKALKEKEKGETINNLQELLVESGNIILTGAPGTGKTYLAQEIAAKLIGIEAASKEERLELLQKSGRYGFVQFHPSYDYTDFVEGLRPTKPDANGNIGFRRQNGIFKDFCKDALIAWEEDKEDGKRKFVFVIDEINRGEISKIFGELFFSIDPGYRGVDGRVKTQYQNLITDKTDQFFDGFYVPKNVYIIGTMNDIDRSVDSFDFAMRRRFTWIEVKAKDTQSMLVNDDKLKLVSGLIDESIKRMDSLNAKISIMEGLNPSYHVGASYFLKLKNYEGDKKNRFKELWDKHLNSLLFEYVRNLSEPEKKLEQLKNAYNLIPEANNVDDGQQ